MKSSNRKRCISLVFIAIMLISILTLLTSCDQDNETIPIPQVRQNVFIYDEDNIIDDNIEDKLNTMLIELKEKTGTEFAVISVKSLLGKNIESYANTLFNTLGIGEKNKDNGILLLMSNRDTKVRLEIGRGLEGCLNDSKCGKILDKHFVSYRESHEYSKATDQTVQAVLKVLCQEYGITINGIDSTIETEENNNTKPSTIVFWIFIGILLLLCVIFTLFVDGGSSGGGSYYGGSSGGFSSSGGFGGGFSGGGGASR